MRDKAGIQTNNELPSKPFPLKSQLTFLIPCPSKQPLIWKSLETTVQSGFTSVGINIEERPSTAQATSPLP